MSLAKVVTIGTIAIFGVIGAAAVVKKSRAKQEVARGNLPSEQTNLGMSRPQMQYLQAQASGIGAATGSGSAPALAQPMAPQAPVRPVPPSTPLMPAPPPGMPPNAAPGMPEGPAMPPGAPPPLAPPAPVAPTTPSSTDDFPNIDRIHQLFTTGPMKLPIVETISYASSVPWIKGRPAWVADYAAYYGTSRHFIARSLNGKPDYFTQKVSTGSRFNVFKKDKNINFYLLIDIARCKMGFYYVDLDTQERVLLKTYKVGLGQPNAEKPSGCLTPMGKYSLGSKVAIYKPGVMSYFQDQTTEMIQVFGTRWIPFDLELEGATSSSRGYGIHGAPWMLNTQTGQLVENRECIGMYDSDGCIRLASEDIEELFAIVITKPTYVVIVKDFHDAMLPGTEVATPVSK